MPIAEEVNENVPTEMVEAAIENTNSAADKVKQLTLGSFKETVVIEVRLKEMLDDSGINLEQDGNPNVLIIRSIKPKQVSTELDQPKSSQDYIDATDPCEDTDMQKENI